MGLSHVYHFSFFSFFFFLLNIYEIIFLFFMLEKSLILSRYRSLQLIEQILANQCNLLVTDTKIPYNRVF